MFTITSLKNRVLAALSLCAILACGAAMANDPFQDTMRDAVARNDAQLLPNDISGGATFIGSATTGNQNTGAYRSTMRDAFARNDAQLLPSDVNGGATFLGRSNSYAGDQSAYDATMRYAFQHNDTQLLPETK